MTGQSEHQGALYVVATPLGNLADLSARQRETLAHADWIAAEDTRHSAFLLRHLGLSTARCFAAHMHNEEEAAKRITARLMAGETVALISDAGTPAISDPGARIVARVRAAGFMVVPVPGPCAAITALSAAGLVDPHWLFHGFLPSRAGQRQTALTALAALPFALVFYEAPHRVLETLADMAITLGGERHCVIARELTKRFEQIHALPLAEAHDWLAAEPQRQKGEFVLIVAAPQPHVASVSAPVLDAETERTLALLLAEGLPVKQVARLAAALTGAPRNALYTRTLVLKGQKE
ncbi:MAG: 16S rRNA (cytidine(1402)-2'-O)-methyltransferase [Zoogloeaceae bacterium]|jgi:16S rRNA (cytidine1402-2'-O)-methyltransferase|nr:16S rRNA (cytidine(1402)-2'-O)-methyltransferase [Zoogloeaceae bacterium]